MLKEGIKRLSKRFIKSYSQACLDICIKRDLLKKIVMTCYKILLSKCIINASIDLFRKNKKRGITIPLNGEPIFSEDISDIYSINKNDLEKLSIQHEEDYILEFNSLKKYLRKSERIFLELLFEVGDYNIICKIMKIKIPTCRYCAHSIKKVLINGLDK